MSQALMHPTLTGVNQTIEDVLDDYPVHPYHLAFAMPELRQKLVAHILSQLSYRPLVKDVEASPTTTHIAHYARLQERLRMEMLVRGSILHILRENAAWLSRHFSNL